MAKVSKNSKVDRGKNVAESKNMVKIQILFTQLELTMKMKNLKQF